MSRKPIGYEEHERRLELYNQGLSDHQIAEILYYNVSTIRNWRTKNKLHTNYDAKNSRIETNEEAERIRLYNKGYTDSEIGYRCGLKKGSVSAWRRKRGLPPNKKIKK